MKEQIALAKEDELKDVGAVEEVEEEYIEAEEEPLEEPLVVATEHLGVENEAEVEINPLTKVESSDIEGKESDVDFDLSLMGPDMVFATVMNFIMNPNDYEGKSVRVFGNYYTLHDEITGLDYQYCLIKDAQQCCAQGLEFVLKDASEGYPAQESYVTVEGIFETYTEGTHPDGSPVTYLRIGDATLKVQQ